MKNVKHTPGPWSSPENRSQFINVRELLDANGKRFAHIQFGAPSREVSDEEIEADINLFAAAPELLEALKKARRFVVSSHDPVGSELDEIDTAIAKATGSAE